ncbi:MAG: cell wall metabolism sensor histidine kinase WalK, partial [Anaerolineae bacterium]|nr:cell wall metabolism sensor histidine kinase WalK [Anaerolineae bacterium]
IGIPADQQEKIFERFYRVDQARSAHTGGMGLGLAISLKIIEGHGGQIEVSSELNTGSTFCVVLPVHI